MSGRRGGRAAQRGQRDSWEGRDALPRLTLPSRTRASSAKRSLPPAPPTPTPHPPPTYPHTHPHTHTPFPTTTATCSLCHNPDLGIGLQLADAGGLQPERLGPGRSLVGGWVGGGGGAAGALWRVQLASQACGSSFTAEALAECRAWPRCHAHAVGLSCTGLRAAPAGVCRRLVQLVRKQRRARELSGAARRLAAHASLQPMPRRCQV